MNRHDDHYDEAWFATLDAMITGKEPLAPEADDLLFVAAKLSEALAPLSDPNVSVERPDMMHSQQIRGEAAPSKGGKPLLLRWLLTAAALFLVLFGVVAACPISPQISEATGNASQRIWQATTSFAQIDASSVALLAAEKSGVRPLLPLALPEGTQAVEFGIITDGNDPHAFLAFAADYRVSGQDISLYEQPTNLVFPSSAAQNVSLGANKAQLFQDTAGNSILQWYQDGMTCQLASMLPVNELLAIARQFQQITNWDLIL